MIDKKQRERQIFNMVYSDASFADVVENECPDFLVRLSAGSPPFGVEVTEFYESETSARLDRITDYSLDLLDGNDFKHKVDRAKLDVANVDIVDKDGSIRAKDVPAIICSVPSLSECSRQIAERIKLKTEQIRNTIAELSHTNLLIRDKTGLLRVVKAADFYQVYFLPELISALSTTLFREVFLIAEIDNATIYVRMKMLLLLADALYFNNAMVKHGFVERFAPYVDGGELFASYFASTVEAPVLVRHDADGTEVIFGDSGVIVTPDGSVIVRLHADRPIHPDAKPPSVRWETLLGTEFHELMTDYRKSNVFSSDFVFPVNLG
jgi:hypothetical protein